MTIEELILLCNLQRETQISPLQEWILREAWEGKTYGAMAQKSNYVEEYLRRTAANLWTKISQGLNDNVTKYNLRKLVEKRPLTSEQKQLIRQNQQQQQQQLPSPPGQTLPLGSLFYLEHPALETGMRNSLAKGNCLLRIQGAPKFGKTSFLQRVIGYAKELQYLPVIVSCKEIAKEIAQDPSHVIGSDAPITSQAYINALNQRMWRTIGQYTNQYTTGLDQSSGSLTATEISPTLPAQAQSPSQALDQLSAQPQAQLQDQLQGRCCDHWRYQLADTPLLLVITELDQLLNQPAIGETLRATLGQWHHQANTLPECAGLSIVVTYTVEQANHPWRCGVKLSLPPLSLDQVKELARRYGLTEATPVPFSPDHCRLLYDYVGGHPFLVQQALYELWLRDKTCPTLTQFPHWLQQAGQQNGCFGEYMRGLWLQLNAVPHWQKFLPLIAKSQSPLSQSTLSQSTASQKKASQNTASPLPYGTAYELISLAIINQTQLHQGQNDDQGWQWRCHLYENVLGHLAQLSVEVGVGVEHETAGVSGTNHNPLATKSAPAHRLSPSGDPQSDIPHGHSVYSQPREQQITLMWQDGLIHQVPIAAILCQVDYYHTYRCIYGEAAAKDCWHRIGQVLRECLAQHLNHSYGQLGVIYPQDGERFLILLANTTAYGADCLATNLRSNVKALNISTNSVTLQVGGFPDSVMTISIGVASVLPTPALQPSYLLDLAQQGLDRANEEGGDRICVDGTTEHHTDFQAH